MVVDPPPPPPTMHVEFQGFGGELIRSIMEEEDDLEVETNQTSQAANKGESGESMLGPRSELIKCTVGSNISGVGNEENINSEASLIHSAIEIKHLPPPPPPPQPESEGECESINSSRDRDNSFSSRYQTEISARSKNSRSDVCV